MIFRVALLFAWKAAAHDSCPTKALSLVQTKKEVSKMHALEGEGLLSKTGDLAVVATRSSKAWVDNLVVQHSSRSAQLQDAHEKATKGLQATREKERNLLAKSQTTPAPNLTAHHENSSAHYREKLLDANATQCRECGNAEEALVAATHAALMAHAEAQKAAAVLGLAAKNYATASQGFGAANKEYTQVVGSMCPITLSYSAAEPAFDVIASAAQDLKQKALIAQQHKAWEMANKTIVDAAQAQYDAAAARANAAEQPIAAKEASKAAACTSIVTHAGPIVKVVYSAGNVPTHHNTGLIDVKPGVSYTVSFEILRNDLQSWSEYVSDVIVDGQSLGKCNPDGGDYDCTFFRCPFTGKVVTPKASQIAVNIKIVGHSRDCDCDTTTWDCSSEQLRVPGRTPVTAVGRFTLTPIQA